MASYTPMIEQYLRIKAQYEDAFLFFRLGDFYEMFFEDAKKAARELEITLTSRDGGKEGRIPMCGVPYHSAESYISRLIEKGYKVAICEQTEDPKRARGVVRREVVRLITPGTVMEGKMLHEKENNFIVALSAAFDKEEYGMTACDLSTGEMRAVLIESDFTDVIGEIAASGAREVIVSANHDEKEVAELKKRLGVAVSTETAAHIPKSLHSLVDGLKEKRLRKSTGRLLSYLLATQKRQLDHLQPVQRYETKEYMKIDMYSRQNLELVRPIRGDRQKKKGSLLWLLDETSTAMGGRLLKDWIERPLVKQNEIEKRQRVVAAFIKHFFERQELRDQLKGVYDLERLVGRMAYGNVNARDMIQLKVSLRRLPEIVATVKRLEEPDAQQMVTELDLCQEVVDLLQKSIHEEAPHTLKEGNIIKDGYDQQLDEYRLAAKDGKAWIASLQQREREKTGIKSLKVGYNKVFGYYIEVTKANIKQLPAGRYERKQTLANAERFITPELKEKERIILEAEEKMVELEYELFLNIRERVKAYIPKLQQIARVIARLDVLQSFATVSEERRYTKPAFSQDGTLEIKAGRHPVVEKVMESEKYVENDVLMNQTREILLITGPNMGGKSTYMRQVALCAVMAQIGCFVPARSCRLPVFDRVFTRIGAADDLVGGKSTFMVEMLETQYAISRATKNSLILLDEIGRGTSTYDGIALARAIIEHIHHQIGAKTLFSTHYHELTEMEKSLERLKNVHVSAVEEKGGIVFLHKVNEGAADKSYGIHVAELAGLPEALLERARAVLAELQNENNLKSRQKTEDSRAARESNLQRNQNQNVKTDNRLGQLSLFETAARERVPNYLITLEERLLSLDLLTMTPLEAMNRLYALQQWVKKKQSEQKGD